MRESYVGIYSIYVLKNPFTDEIFYVGQTAKNLNARLAGHIIMMTIINQFSN